MSANRKRKVQKNLYFSAVEWERTVRRMRSYGFTNFSEYARQVLATGQIRIHSVQPSNDALVAQVARVGNNINQIARQANNDDVATFEMCMQAVDLLGEIRRLVADDSTSKAHGDRQGSAGEADAESSDQLYLQSRQDE